MADRRPPKGRPAATPAPERNAPTNLLIFSETLVKRLFVIGVVGAITILVAILMAWSLLPQGRYVTPDRAQYVRTLETATQTMSHFREDPTTGRLAVPIELAMQIVAERGVADIDFAVAGPEQAPRDPTAPDAEIALPDGGQVYANCAGCHGANGQGVPGVFPPLAFGHTPSLYAADGGREYLIHVMLYGLGGPITVLGNAYNGVMPAWQHFSDEQVAAVLNYIMTAWDNEAPEGFEAFGPAEVAAERGLNLTQADVLQQRRALGFD